MEILAHQLEIYKHRSKTHKAKLRLIKYIRTKTFKFNLDNLVIWSNAVEG